MKEEPLRLSKLMTQQGICSRREADRYIEMGQVLVDGEVVSVLGTKVLPDAVISLLPKAKKAQREKATILLNKPIGYVSTQPEDGYTAAIELITRDNQEKGKVRQSFQQSHLIKLGVAGRLDIDSKGLLVFTQDGALAKKLIGQDCGMEKEYLVGIEGKVTPAVLGKMRSGLSLDGQRLKPAKVDVLSDQLLRVVLKEGKKRQIRRMAELVGVKVIKIKRVRIGRIRLGDLPEGKWRYLEDGEQF